ncbi:MAG: MgtC/SapB family protein [Clostridia bacterium]
MESVMEYLRELTPVTMVIRLLLALVIGGLVGIQRQRHGRAAGFRTHIIVCLGATLTTMTGMYLVDEIGMVNIDPLRIGAQVMSGIGFLGIGTIIITGNVHVKGLTTAAGLWSIAAVGLALGIGFYEGALICGALLVLVISYFTNFGAKRLKIDTYIEISGCANINGTLKAIMDKGYSIDNIDVQNAKSGVEGNIGFSIVIGIPRKTDPIEIMNSIAQIENVVLAIKCD